MASFDFTLLGRQQWRIEEILSASQSRNPGLFGNDAMFLSVCRVYKHVV